MRDKSFDIFLAVLFGISGVIAVILAWIQPMVASERILTTFVGSAGLFIALTRARLPKPLPDDTGTEQIPMEVRSEDKY